MGGFSSLGMSKANPRCQEVGHITGGISYLFNIVHLYDLRWNIFLKFSQVLMSKSMALGIKIGQNLFWHFALYIISSYFKFLPLCFSLL